MTPYKIANPVFRPATGRPSESGLYVNPEPPEASLTPDTLASLQRIRELAQKNRTEYARKMAQAGKSRNGGPETAAPASAATGLGPRPEKKRKPRFFNQAQRD